MPHYRKLASGNIRVIVQHDGLRASGTAPNRREAERLYHELYIGLGGTPKSAGMSVGELLDDHLTEHDYRPTTLADLTRVADKLPATFRKRRVAEVEPVVIDALYRQLIREGWTPHRVKRVHSLLGSAFQRAKRRGWCRDVPTRDADLPKLPERDDTTPDVTAMRLLLEHAPPDFRAYVWLAATTGARRGELCALQWADIDVAGQVIRIRRAASYTPAAGLVVGDVKTGPRGRRGIPIDRHTLHELWVHRRQMRARQQHGWTKTYKPSPWIFTEDHVYCWRPDLATHRFVDLRNAVGLPTVRLHDTRHFVASELLGGITDARTAADHLGHSRPSMTSDRYARSIDQRRRDAAAELRHRLQP